MPHKLSDSDIGSEKFREVTYRLAVGEKLFHRQHVSVQVSFVLRLSTIEQDRVIFKDDRNDSLSCKTSKHWIVIYFFTLFTLLSRVSVEAEA